MLKAIYWQLHMIMYSCNANLYVTLSLVTPNALKAQISSEQVCSKLMPKTVYTSCLVPGKSVTVSH